VILGDISDDVPAVLPRLANVFNTHPSKSIRFRETTTMQKDGNRNILPMPSAPLSTRLITRVFTSRFYGPRPTREVCQRSGLRRSSIGWFLILLNFLAPLPLSFFSITHPVRTNIWQYRTNPM
jgi:hypothetical protein